LQQRPERTTKKGRCFSYDEEEKAIAQKKRGGKGIVVDQGNVRASLYKKGNFGSPLSMGKVRPLVVGGAHAVGTKKEESSNR